MDFSDFTLAYSRLPVAGWHWLPYTRTDARTGEVLRLSVYVPSLEQGRELLRHWTADGPYHYEPDGEAPS
jgi:hypothetical protein